MSIPRVSSPLKSEAAELINRYKLHGRLGSLDYRDRIKVVEVVEQFKIAYYVWRKFGYRAWFKQLNFEFWQYFRYEIYYQEYLVWLTRNKFLDFAVPNDLQDKNKEFTLDNGSKVRGGMELYSSFMEWKANCRKGYKEKVWFGDVQLELERTGRSFEPPHRPFYRRWKSYKRHDAVHKVRKDDEESSS